LWKILGFLLKYTRHHCPRSQGKQREGEERRGAEGSQRKIEVLKDKPSERRRKGKRRNHCGLEKKSLFEMILIVGLTRRRSYRMGKMEEYTGKKIRTNDRKGGNVLPYLRKASGNYSFIPEKDTKPRHSRHGEVILS